MELTSFSEIRGGHRSPRCTVEELEELLQKKVAPIEIVSPIEVWTLDEEGRRKRRICGQYKSMRLPRFVPDGVTNPHGVQDPQQEYRCAAAAGYRTDHPGIGPCKWHSGYMKKTSVLVREQYLLGGDAMSEDEAVVKCQFDDYIEKVRAEYSDEDLWNIQRVLVELEALKLQVRDALNEKDVIDLDLMDQFIKLTKQALDAQMTQVKRDQTLLQLRGVKEVLQAMVNGVISLIEEEAKAHPELIIRILGRLETDVLVPISEQGYTELLRRQEVSGVAGRVRKLTEEIIVEDKDSGS